MLMQKSKSHHHPSGLNLMHPVKPQSNQNSYNFDISAMVVSSGCRKGVSRKRFRNRF